MRPSAVATLGPADGPGIGLIHVAKTRNCLPDLADGATLRGVAASVPSMAESASGLTLAAILVATSGLFCLTTLFFGTKGGFYDTKAYDGNGTAH